LEEVTPLALIEGCKHSLEVTVPLDEVEREEAAALAEVSAKVRIPGFRPGKVPPGLAKTRFSAEIRQQVLDKVIPKALGQAVERENLRVVSRPDIVDMKWDSGQPIWFKAEFEVSPAIELGEYRGLTVKYSEPVVTDEDVEKRVEEIRDSKAEYVNIDPRPAEDGDYVLVNLKSIAGVEKPVERDDLSLKIGDKDALPAFNENLLGMNPGESKEFTVTYPEGYAEESLSGKTVTFDMKLNAIRRKELPDLNDEFAKDLGDFQTLDELRNMVKASLLREREHHAKNEAKMRLVEQLIATHEFPVPEVFIDRQIRDGLEQRLASLIQQGVDPEKLNLDWKAYREANKEQGSKDVKASLLLEKIADREAIETMRDEMDKEIQRIARAQRRPVAQVRMDLEKNNRMPAIASQIRTEKVLNFLFDNARKEAAD
jgi:trigger factor